MGVPLGGTGVTVDNCLDIRVGLDLNVDWDPIWQVLSSRLNNIASKAINFRLTIELGRHRHMHPLQGPILVLSLGRNPANVREEVLNLALKIGEGTTCPSTI